MLMTLFFSQRDVRGYAPLCCVRLLRRVIDAISVCHAALTLPLLRAAMRALCRYMMLSDVSRARQHVAAER